jgi:hypothetical protein
MQAAEAQMVAPQIVIRNRVAVALRLLAKALIRESNLNPNRAFNRQASILRAKIEIKKT